MTTGDLSYKSLFAGTDCLKSLTFMLAKVLSTIQSLSFAFNMPDTASLPNPFWKPRLNVEIRRLEVKPLACFNGFVSL